jgi:hypothetical protein
MSFEKLTPSIEQDCWTADAEQVGQAAALRHGGLSPEDKVTCNQIIHSGDKNPDLRGPNPYADPSKSYDPKAQEALDKIAAKPKK